jgi:hypothetical protein
LLPDASTNPAECPPALDDALTTQPSGFNVDAYEIFERGPGISMPAIIPVPKPIPDEPIPDELIPMPEPIPDAEPGTNADA